MILSAVIPTKSRPADLERAVASVYGQQRLPDELLIIDQSPDNASRLRIEALTALHPAMPALHYVLEPAIKGLVHAKQVASGIAQSDVVCFLEDDEVLEPGYLAAIERGFLDHPDMLGCCGLVTNLPPLPAGYETLFHLFHRGMFFDRRVGVHGRAQAAGEILPLIPSDYLSGGLSCWRREVLARVPFDIENGFHMLEDVDYSTRAVQTFGAHFYINPNARLDHRMSPVNREVLGQRERRKMREYVLFYRKRAGRPAASLSFAWLLFGLLLESLVQCLRARNASPLTGYFTGIADGYRWKLRSESR